jgi:hypothetical protein
MNETTLYIQKLEAEIADNHAQWRADQEKIIYWQQQCEVYKATLGAIYEAMSPHYEEAN